MPNEFVKDRGTLYWVRRTNLSELINDRFAGSYSAISQQLEWPEETVRRFFYPATRGRSWPITDRAAREIERKLDLVCNSLDSASGVTEIEIELYRFRIRDASTGEWKQSAGLLSKEEAAKRYGEGNYRAIEWTKEIQRARALRRSSMSPECSGEKRFNQKNGNDGFLTLPVSGSQGSPSP